MELETHNTHQKNWPDHIRQAFLMAAEGLPLRRIVEELDRAGATGPSGRPLSVATLWRHLNDPIYYTAGSRAVVSERVFSLAQEGLAGRRRS